jgi:NAD(P)H-dependent FMN reductase
MMTHHVKPLQVLALCGSLRQASINAALLRAAARLAPAGMTIAMYPQLGDLPLFNPDLEAADPAPVRHLRERLLVADAVLIASPEYAHGVTGVMKNALDWMVGNESFVNKPVALWNASPMSLHAPASLKEIVSVMSAVIIESASVTVPLRGARLDEDGIVAHPSVAPALRQALAALGVAVASLQREASQ